ncbi:Uncharacterized protein QTN25_004406 [Entamoeba marina]
MHCDILLDMIKQNFDVRKAIEVLRQTLLRAPHANSLKTNLVTGGILDILIQKLDYDPSNFFSSGMIPYLSNQLSNMTNDVMKSSTALLIWKLIPNTPLPPEEFENVFKQLQSLLVLSPNHVINVLGALQSLTSTPHILPCKYHKELIQNIIDLPQVDAIPLLSLRLFTNLITFNTFQPEYFNIVSAFIIKKSTNFLSTPLNFLNTNTSSNTLPMNTYMVHAIQEALTQLSHYITVPPALIEVLLSVPTVPFLSFSLSQLLLNTSLPINTIAPFITSHLHTQNPRFLFLLYNILYNCDPTCFPTPLRKAFISSFTRIYDVQCIGIALAKFWFTNHYYLLITISLKKTTATKQIITPLFTLIQEHTLHNDLSLVFMKLANPPHARAFIEAGGITAVVDLMRRCQSKEILNRCVGILYVMIDLSNEVVHMNREIKLILDVTEELEVWGLLLTVIPAGKEQNRIFNISMRCIHSNDITTLKVGLYALRGLCLFDEWVQHCRKDVISNEMKQIIDNEENEHVVRICLAIVKKINICNNVMVESCYKAAIKYIAHHHLVSIVYKYLLKIKSICNGKNQMVNSYVLTIYNKADNVLKKKLMKISNN